jgi:hypothetical protein
VLPWLQELRLAACRLTAQLAVQLLSATTLTHLGWGAVKLYSSDSWTEQLTQEQVFKTLWKQLQLLPKLSSLQLEDPGLPTASFSPISSLQHLQRYVLGTWEPSTACAAAAALPAGVTYLHLAMWGSAMWGSDFEEQPEGAVLAGVSLTRLSKLQSLGAQALRMRPSNLACMTMLRELDLINPCNPDGSPFSPRELLAALQHLNQLRHLRLLGCQLHAVGPQPDQQGDGYQCFSGLTASTQLTALHLLEPCDVPVPVAAFGHMFLTGRVLRSLEVLRLEGSSHHATCLGAPQVARIAASCPALRELRLSGVTGAGVDARCLLLLPSGLTRLDGLDWLWANP